MFWTLGTEPVRGKGFPFLNVTSTRAESREREEGNADLSCSRRKPLSHKGLFL